MFSLNPNPHNPSRPEPKAEPMTAEEAARLIREGRGFDGMRVAGRLSFKGDKRLAHLPDGLQCQSLDVSDCAGLTALPEGLRCNDLIAQNLRITEVPGLEVKFRLDLSGCERLERLPENLKAGSLLLRDCAALQALPEGLDVYFLDISGCVGLERFPRRGRVQVGHLTARGCFRLRALPEWLDKIAQLDLSGCVNVGRIPDHLRISSWLDLADSGLSSPDCLPAGRRIPLRWKGVPIDERIAFRPETITGREVLATRNVELRRVLLERMGHERFILEADAKVLDRDTDTGGERRLVRVPLEGDEDLVALWVICPSTGRNYVLRVPPTLRKCRQAAAWIAGFDNADDYNPLIET